MLYNIHVSLYATGYFYMIVTVYELMVGSGKINSKQKCYKENLMKRYSLTWKREIQGEEENCQVIGGGRGGGFLEVPAH